MEQLQRTITLNFKIGAVDRSFTIAFPKVGQYMAVECRKAELSSTMNGDSQYLNLVRTSTKRSFFALDLVDMSAWFEVLIPDLMKDSVGDGEFCVIGNAFPNSQNFDIQEGSISGPDISFDYLNPILFDQAAQ